ncbi:MAG: cytochrome c3 family protein [Acidobacteriota bacterium]|nr:cytochrome c3 family protein [Acidobacteriota bacterium]
MALWWLPAALGAPPAAAAAVPPEIQECLDCHEDPDLVLTLADGDELSLEVDGAAFLASVHGAELICTDCHEGYSEDHPFDEPPANRRSYVIHSYDLCKPCHFETYTRTLESVHYEHLAEGFEAVPVCADCHGAHDIGNPHRKQAMLSHSCATCHQEIFDVYRASVHGAALSEDVDEVPSCVDCHSAHSIAHPDTVRFRLTSPGSCMECHGDAELMRRYGLLTTVATTYLADFHGVTASLAAGAETEPGQVVVVCIDCHGFHDVQSPAALGEEQMKETVSAMCEECHEGAPPGFPGAWLSHYPPSLQHAPLVYLVGLFYKIFIPFVVLGLALQVGLHLYRYSTRP